MRSTAVAGHSSRRPGPPARAHAWGLPRGSTTLEPVKEFVVYTGLRILLFVAALGVVLGIWVPLAGEANLLWAFVIALVVSGVGSYFLLNGPREALAQRVDARARAATSRFEEMRAKEDQD